jgi:hypothetical protein
MVQKNLFGDRDEIMNALTLERKLIIEGIEACKKGIRNKEEEIKDLERRATNLTRALKMLASLPDGKKAGDKK